MIPIDIIVYNKYYYIVGQLKGNNKHNHFKLVKMHPDETIMDEYFSFSDTIMNFDILDLDGKTYIVIKSRNR